MPGVPGGSSPNAVGEFYVPTTAPSWSPITFQQSVDSATPVAAVVQKQVAKPVAATSTVLPVNQKQVGKSLAATSAVASSLSKQFTKMLALAVSASAAVASLATQLTKLLSMGTATTAVAANVSTSLQKAAARIGGRARHVAQAFYGALPQPRLSFGRLSVWNPIRAWLRCGLARLPGLQVRGGVLSVSPVLRGTVVPLVGGIGALDVLELYGTGTIRGYAPLTLSDLLVTGILDD